MADLSIVLIMGMEEDQNAIIVTMLCRRVHALLDTKHMGNVVHYHSLTVQRRVCSTVLLGCAHAQVIKSFAMGAHCFHVVIKGPSFATLILVFVVTVLRLHLVLVNPVMQLGTGNAAVRRIFPTAPLEVPLMPSLVFVHVHPLNLPVEKPVAQ